MAQYFSDQTVATRSETYNDQQYAPPSSSTKNAMSGDVSMSSPMLASEAKRATLSLAASLSTRPDQHLQSFVAEFVETAPLILVLIALHDLVYAEGDEHQEMKKSPTSPSASYGNSSPTGRRFPPSPLSLNDVGHRPISAAPSQFSNYGRIKQFRPTPYNPSQSVSPRVVSARKSTSKQPTSLSQSAPCPPRLLTMANGAGASALSTTVVGTISLEIEELQSRVEAQVQVAAQSEVALAQLASSRRAKNSNLLSRVQKLSTELIQLRESNEVLAQEEAVLRFNRHDLRLQHSQVLEQIRETQALLDQERATLSHEVRQAQSREGEAEEDVSSLTAETSSLKAQVAVLQRKLEEGNEVVSAVSAQLIDYKQAVSHLQLQLRRGGRL
jgi:hypothetical protein